MTRSKTLEVSTAQTQGKNVRVIALNGKEFWTTQSGFSAWVKTGLIQVINGQSFIGQLASGIGKPTQVVKYCVNLDENRIRATWFEKEELTPPWIAEYLLYFFMTREDRDNILGDLREEYAEVLSRFGNKGARIWFHKQAISSLLPF